MVDPSLTPDVLITAGAPWKGGLKALLPMGESTLLGQALKAARFLESRIILVGAPSALARQVDVWLPDTGNGADNFLVGLSQVRPGRACLFCCSDLPFVAGPALGRFLAACAGEAVLNYGVTERQAYSQAFPGARRRFVPLREGAYTGAGVLLLQPAGTMSIAATVRRVFHSRKNTVRIAAMLGWRFLVARLTGRNTLSGLERRASEITGVACRAIQAEPCLAYDVDDERDYRYAFTRFPLRPAGGW